MKKILKIILPLFIYTFFLGLILLSPTIVKKAVLDGLNIWINNIIPSMLPFYILSEFLINYGFVQIISFFTNNLTFWLFKAGGEATFIFLMSLLTGTPSSAKYIKELCNQKLINDEEGTKLLTFTHFINPLFIINITYIIFHNFHITIIILITHYLSNIIIGLLFRNYYVSSKKTTSFTKSINSIEAKNFSITLSNAIKKSFNTLLLILGTIIFFLIIINLFNNYLHLNYYHLVIINGLLEITSGISLLNNTNLPVAFLASMITFFLSFGGISIHMQIKSIISDTSIKYYPYLIARIIHASISSLIVYFLIGAYYM